MHMLTSQCHIRWHTSHWLTRPTRIFRFTFLPCSVVLFVFVFSNFHFWWQLSCWQWQCYRQLICVVPLSTCNNAQSWWVCSGAVVAVLYLFTFFFASLPCCIVSFFFRFFSSFVLLMTAFMPKWTVPQSAHLSDATECLQPSTVLMSWGAVKELQRFFFFSSRFFVRWRILNFFFDQLTMLVHWNLPSRTSLLETHRLTFHSAGLL